MGYSKMKLEELLNILNTSKDGLSEQKVKELLSQYGKNKLQEQKKKSKLVKFLNQFKDLMIIILLISSVLSAVLAYYNNETYLDSIIIIFIVILNAILGFVQEAKADKSIESLKKMQVAKSKVKRDNEIYIINSEDLVKGDIIILEAGDSVPADARIIYESSLKVDESALTGESVPCEKNNVIITEDVPISERYNMVFGGTNVVYGKCEAVVCETGMNTEFGKIAKTLSSEEKEITPLQKKIDSISKILSLIITIIIIIMLIIGLIKGMKFTEIIMLSISLAVAAIPEGLPAIITITLSLGMNELAKKNAIVRKMSSVETLGSTEIICSDKTGTITKNQMTVQELIFNNELTNIKDLDKDNILLKSMILNNDATKNNTEYIGDPTEIALIKCLDKKVNVKQLIKQNQRIGELPFDSDRKMMSTINKSEDGITLYTKGSFDHLIKHCSYVQINNRKIKLTDKKRKKLKEIENEESNKAYRVLAFAYKPLSEKYILEQELEQNLIFIGMVSMIDPPRDDVKQAIKTCIDANIKPIMITGDSLFTAKAIAKKIGILNNNSEAITGIELDNMSYNDLKRNIDKYSVYARVSPTNKVDIVNAWKENNKIVAMTGDGVNDAPAIKTGNIGIGMGISGTEVSKSVSDIILTDDSFSSIVTAVKEGRRIFDNIRSALVYLLTGNIAEVIVVFIGVMAGFSIFTPIGLLYINLITDSLPAIALAFEKEADDIMTRKVRKQSDSFFTPFLAAKISLSAIIKTITILLMYAINYKFYGIDSAVSMAFLTLILTEMIFAFSCRNLKKNIITNNMFGNKVMNRFMIILTIIQIIIFVTPIKHIFGIIDISLLQVIYCILVVLMMFAIDELSKDIIKRKFKD